jgi:glycine/D-amino acid oxidase-like deaminating enzyme
MASAAASSVSGTGQKSVIVIGAGIVGLCSALWLLRAGHRVVVIDKRPPGHNTPYDHAASYGNACTIALHACLPVATPGIAKRVPRMLLDPEGPLAIRWQYLPRLAPWLVAFLKASRTSEVERIAGTLAHMLARTNEGYAPLIEEARLSNLLRHAGCLYLYKSEERFRAGQRDLDLRRRHGVAIDDLDAARIRELEPNLAPLYHRGVLFKESYSIESPHHFALGLAEAIRARGGRFVQGEGEHVGIGPDGVEIRGGEDRHMADYIVIAGGAWSGKIVKQIGDRVPLETERGYHVMFPGAASLLNRPVCYAEHGFYMTPMKDGLRAAGTVELAGLTAPLNSIRTRKIAQVARMLLPQLGQPGSEWLGFRSSLPDSLPVIGPSPRSPRVIYAFGHGHIGLTLAGITGKLVAEIVSGQASTIDLAPLRADRFRLI